MIFLLYGISFISAEYSNTCFNFLDQDVRKDYKEIIPPLFDSLSIETCKSDNSNKTQIFWGLHLKDISSKNFSRLKIVNTAPGTKIKIFGSKLALAFLLQNKTTRYFPETLLYPPSSTTKKFLTKSNDQYSGKGVSFTFEKLPENIFQEYILGLTIDGFKFDTRWWILVLFDPFKVYMVEKAYIRKSRVSFQRKDFSNKCMHVTSSMIQNLQMCKNQGRFYSRQYEKVKDIYSTSDARFYDKIFTCEKENFDWNEREMLRNTKEAIRESFLISKELFLKYRNETKANVFQLLSYDIIYNNSGHPFIEEINTNGYLASGMKKVSQMNENILLDMFFTIFQHYKYKEENICLQKNQLWKHIL
eukprot:snap_masked-scaffold_4-processed-gene-5.48-mRNA-1 protein AED:1.00 eAED:1.00 QI:0/-1/0/0/-1/1/1/0/359